MKKLMLSMCFTSAFLVTAAVAQGTPGGSQGTQQSSPGMSQPSQQQPGMGQPSDNSQSGQMGQGQNGANNQDKGEKKLKGCVQSQGGQFILETKKGKTVSLTGQDVSAHVGHEVEVKGTWASGSSSAVSAGSSSDSSEKTFNVASVQMKSESCGGKHHDNAAAGSSTGSSGGSSTGSTTGGSTGNSTTPPQ
jgi:hypothetical protein